MDFDLPSDDDPRRLEARRWLAEQVLGLPREPDAEAGLTWSEAQKARRG
ncbi:MAG: hypothetical protein OXE79_01725 [Acidimicrobiaceae bacterium]|nr:hypothetical protein [Acidimicrobiaceae bacterium]MCY4175899.1 hypothetical protein [Acidimicrobiaceae bacterium]MCY4280878.1 hypothetical protein [Acidimicrobiaceae bacterium]MCY4293317.1 hypothetical protein [Acidimicrobiaceae bacterium]